MDLELTVVDLDRTVDVEGDLKVLERVQYCAVHVKLLAAVTSVSVTVVHHRKHREHGHT